MKKFFVALILLTAPVASLAEQVLFAAQEIQIRPGSIGATVAPLNLDQSRKDERYCVLVTDVQKYQRKVSKDAFFELVDYSSSLAKHGFTSEEMRIDFQFRFGYNLDPEEEMNEAQLIARAKEMFAVNYEEYQTYTQTLNIQSKATGKSLKIVCKSSAYQTINSVLDYLSEHGVIKPSREL